VVSDLANIEAYFVGGEVDKFREARRNMEYAFSLLDETSAGASPSA
jgi:hypothetical protein